MVKHNPFDISFGKKPVEAIATIMPRREIMGTFTGEPITSQIYMITGVRGSGKTVLMNSIANSLEEADWLVVRLNPDRSILNALGSKLCSHPAGTELFRSAKLNLSLFGVELEFAGEPPITDVETAIENMLKTLKKRHKRVLVTIDEVTDNSYIREFAGAFQILVGQELPIFLLMTGLYENIEELQNEKNLTFLYRAPKIRMAPLNLGRIASRYEVVFDVSHEKAVRMAGLTKGYPFAFQALGYSAWNNRGDEEAIMAEYRQILEEYVYEKIWSELSAKDKQISLGISHCPGGRVKDIVADLGLKPGEINQYRKRLIRKGIVSGEEYGHMMFMLPLFDKFVLDQMAMSDSLFVLD